MHNHSGCPGAKPWAVVKDSDGSIAGCHASEADANAQLAALYGSENSVDDHSGESFASVDNTAWDGGAAMAGCNDATCYRSICAGRRSGPPDQRGSWALPHHKHSGSPPNAAGVRNALARLDQTEGLTNKEEARRHLESHMASIRNEESSMSTIVPPLQMGGVVPTTSTGMTITLPPGSVTAASPMPSGHGPSYAVDAPPADAPPPADATAPVEDQWFGILSIENAPSGDGRRFAAGSLTWRDLPIPLYWQRLTTSGHDASSIVGSIEAIWRDGANIMGSGRFNLNAPPGGQSASDAADAYQLVKDGFMRGVSIKVDDVKEHDIEMIWPDQAEVSELEAMLMDPEEIIFNHARIISAALLGEPAYQEAYIQLGVMQTPELATAAVMPHSVETVDEPWDLPEALKTVPNRVTAEYAAEMYAWVMGESTSHVTRQQCMLPHHVKIGGPANLAACSAAIEMLNGGRGGANIPTADRGAVYEHLAQHIRDAGMAPPPLATLEEATEKASLTAALHVPTTPPAVWFENPNFSEITPIQVGDDGWVRGHLAKWGVCHTSFANACVTPPHEDEFSYFTTGELLTREGSRVPVGQLTMGTGHAPGHLEARPAAVHYDHTGYAVADVTCGADQHGIWVAGALCPDVDELTIRRLRASALSGDWRRINNKLRLVAALVVNVPGFPIPRTRSHVHDGAQSALVASGVVADVERSETTTLQTIPENVAKLMADVLRAEVMGPVIEKMRHDMEVGS